jgi:hypothetical protein
MFEPKITISKGLYAKLEEAASVAGYSSAEEFALHILEQAAATVEDTASEDEVRERLKGLGYLG